MLNQTKVIRYIEMELGFKFTDLEISHEEMIDVIEMRTLPTFSKYFPYQKRHVISRSEDLVKNYRNRYHIKIDEEIINVNKVINVNNRSYVADNVNATPHPAYGQGLGSFLERQVISDLASGSTNPVTWQYYHPHMIEITPNLGEKILVEMNVVHPTSFITIPTNMEEVFLELASIDVRAALFPMRNRFNNMETTFGTLDLFIESLESARDERKELVERMQGSAGKTGRRKKLWIG